MSHRDPISSANLSEGKSLTSGARVDTVVLRLFLLSFSLVGLIQGVAIEAYIYHSWAWGALPAWIAAYVLALIPILGGVAGFYAATKYWHWPVIWSAFVFVFPYASWMLGKLIVASSDRRVAPVSPRLE
jgi:hypothetical protein